MVLDRTPTSDNPVGTWKNSAEKQRGKTARKNSAEKQRGKTARKNSAEKQRGKTARKNSERKEAREGRRKADLIKRAQHAVKTLQKLAVPGQTPIIYPEGCLSRVCLLQCQAGPDS